MMMKKTVLYVTLFVLSLLTVGCDKTIHQYPADTSVIDLTVKLSADLTAPEHFIDIFCDAKNGMTVVEAKPPQRVQGDGPDRVFNSNMCMRFTVDLYRVDGTENTIVERKICYAEIDTPVPQAETTFKVGPYKYKVLVWTDYVYKADKASWYYDVTDLKAVFMRNILPEDNNDKDAFTGVMPVSFTEFEYTGGHHEKTIEIPLYRPLGRYKLIAEDVDEYIEHGGRIDELTTKVTYTIFVGSGYNVLEQTPNRFDDTRSFESKAVLEADGTLVLAYDYLLVNGDKSVVNTDFVFTDAKGNKVSEWLGVKIEMFRNKETVLRGRFLTTSYGSGGIGIKDAFDGDEIIYPIPD